LTVPTLYQGEAKIRRVTYSSTQGASVALELPDMDAMHAFLGSEGKRLMLVAVLVGDDEQPVPASHDRKRSQRAWLLCRDSDFQRFLYVSNEAEAKLRILERCAIDSRSELDSNNEAAACFDLLLSSYNDWIR
jgi:hypothetical protein